MLEQVRENKYTEVMYSCVFKMILKGAGKHDQVYILGGSPWWCFLGFNCFVCLLVFVLVLESSLVVCVKRL